MDILHANLGYNVSYAWRSIHKSIWIIQKGGCWRIGNGQTIKIWEDHWIPSHNGYKIISPNRGNPDIQVVKDLFLQDDSGWDTKLIEENFLKIDADSITPLPIINTDNKDEYMWMHEQNSIYSVKSGYQFLQHWKTNSSTSPTTSNNSTNLWKKLWSIHTIPRHNLFLWRILNNALPLRVSLEKKRYSLLRSMSTLQWEN